MRCPKCQSEFKPNKSDLGRALANPAKAARARAKALSPKRRTQIARIAGRASAKARAQSSR